MDGPSGEVPGVVGTFVFLGIGFGLDSVMDMTRRHKGGWMCFWVWHMCSEDLFQGQLPKIHHHSPIFTPKASSSYNYHSPLYIELVYHHSPSQARPPKRRPEHRPRPPPFSVSMAWARCSREHRPTWSSRPPRATQHPGQSLVSFGCRSH